MKARIWGCRGSLSTPGAATVRYGGNTSSSYNWQLNASNHANDWYFESIAENSSTAGELGDTQRRILLSGRAADGVAEIGPVICACFGVGGCQRRGSVN